MLEVRLVRIGFDMPTSSRLLQVDIARTYIIPVGDDLEIGGTT